MRRIQRRSGRRITLFNVEESDWLGLACSPPVNDCSGAVVPNPACDWQFTVTFTVSSPIRSRNLLAKPHLEMEPMAGIEPATDGLRNRCSTAELHWHPNLETAREPNKFRFFRNADYPIPQWNSMQVNAMDVSAGVQKETPQTSNFPGFPASCFAVGTGCSRRRSPFKAQAT